MPPLPRQCLGTLCLSCSSWLRGLRVLRLLAILLAARFETRTALLKAGLNIHHSELAVHSFAMSRHRPQKSDGMPRHRYVRMVSTRNQHGIAVTHYRHQFRVLGIVIYELYSTRGIRHIEVDVNLLEHFPMLMRRPACPISWIRMRESYNQTASLWPQKDYQGSRAYLATTQRAI